MWHLLIVMLWWSPFRKFCNVLWSKSPKNRSECPCFLCVEDLENRCPGLVHSRSEVTREKKKIFEAKLQRFSHILPFKTEEQCVLCQTRYRLLYQTSKYTGNIIILKLWCEKIMYFLSLLPLILISYASLFKYVSETDSIFSVLTCGTDFRISTPHCKIEVSSLLIVI